MFLQQKCQIFLKKPLQAEPGFLSGPFIQNMYTSVYDKDCDIPLCHFVGIPFPEHEYGVLP